MKLTEHVYLLSGLLYGENENVYGVIHDNGLLLIDSGRVQTALENIRQQLEMHQLSHLPITDVLLTHMHDDHAGNAAHFRSQGASIWCSEPDASGVESGGIRVNDYGTQHSPVCHVDRRLQHEETFSIGGVSAQIRIFPGHTNGSAFYYFSMDGFSFCATGDTVFPLQIEGGLDAGLGWKGSYEFNKALYLQSLEKAIRYPFDVMLGGHGFPLMKNGSAVVSRAFRKALIEWR